MSTTVFPHRWARSALVAIGLALSTSAIAADTVHELTVTAPEVTRERVGRSTIGAPIDLVAVTHRVDYSDLDLSRTADAAKLQERVRASADHACAELRKIVRFDHVDRRCERQVAQRAMEQVNAAIAAAK